MKKVTVSYMGKDIEIEVTEEQSQEMNEQVKDKVMEIEAGKLTEIIRKNRNSVEYTQKKIRGILGKMREHKHCELDMKKLNLYKSERDFRQGVVATANWLLSDCKGDVLGYCEDPYINNLRKECFGGGDR